MRFLGAVFVGLLAIGCGPKTPPAPTFPPVHAAKPGAPFRAEVVDKSTGRRVMLYPPKGRSRPIGLIVIAAAGSNLVTGMALSAGDMPEHTFWADAGYAVVAYDVSGPMPFKDRESEIAAAMRAFAAQDAGVKDGITAIDAGLRAFPGTEKNVIAVGHSSAATLALALTARDPRVDRCVAFAPVTDVPAHLGSEANDAFAIIPELGEAVRKNSPSALIDRITKPTLLFIAKDDSVVSATDVMKFARQLRETGGSVDLATVETGDHYDAMIQAGQPAARDWLAKKH